MSLKSYTTIVLEIQNDGTYGVQRDTYLWQSAPTFNYGASTLLATQDKSTDGRNILMELVVPEDDDIEGFDDLLKIEIGLRLNNRGGSVSNVVIAMVLLDEIWDEGTQNGTAGEASWNDAQPAVPWGTAGAIASSDSGIDSTETVIDSIRVLPAFAAGDWVWFDITGQVGMGETKTLVIFMLAGADSLFFGSRTHGTADYRPKLKLTYKDNAPDAFSDKDAALSIEPNPNNPEQPLLKWGGVKDADFVQFKLYRETAAIGSVAALTPIATITSPADQEYIDTDALVDGTTYYYMAIAEDGNNTGDDATFSNQIAWTKPNMSARTVSPSGSTAIGATKTVSVTSGNNIKKLYVDWEDGSTSWYEYETVGLTKTATHIYTKVLGSIGSPIAPEVRVEDEDGFWSSQLDTTTTIYTTGSDSDAKIRVSVKKGQLGDYVTLDGSLSQPHASNVTISKYEFKRDATDGWQDNGSNPIYTFKTGTGGGEYPQSIGVKTVSLRVTSSLGTVSSTVTATYELETGAATLLVFSRDCKIHEIPHDLSMDKMVEVPIGSDRVAHEFLISRPPERITLVGTSNHPNVINDVTIIRNAWLNNTFVRFVIKTEMEGKTVTYEGKIDGDISLGQAYDNKQSFSFPLRIITRTEA